MGEVVSLNCQHTLLPRSQCAHCNISRHVNTGTPASKRVPKVKRVKVKSTYSPSPAMMARLGEEGELELPPPAPPITPGHLICSFCGHEVEQTRATTGSGKVRKVGGVEWHHDPTSGQHVYEEVTHHISAHVIACPSCSLNVGPLFNRCVMCKGLSDDAIKSCTYCKGTKRGERSTGGQQWPIGD